MTSEDVCQKVTCGRIDRILKSFGMVPVNSRMDSMTCSCHLLYVSCDQISIDLIDIPLSDRLHARTSLKPVSECEVYAGPIGPSTKKTFSFFWDS